MTDTLDSMWFAVGGLLGLITAWLIVLALVTLDRRDGIEKRRG